MADHHGHDHVVGAETRLRPLAVALSLLVGFMVVEVALGFVAMLLVAYAAVFLSMSATVVIALVVLAVFAIYLRRSRGWPRLPRR